MKFTSSILLISAAIASIASSIPLSTQGSGSVDSPNTILGNTNAYSTGSPLVKRCSDCTHKDTVALNVIIKASADHYADIAHVRLDKLMREIATAKVTSGTEELPKEKALLTITVQSKIDEAKKACTSEELIPAIKAAVAADSNLDVAWSKQEDKKIEKKMAELDIKITQLVLDRIQANINAELLSKDCAEKMTNTEIAPAPETPAPAPETPAPLPETPVPIQETPDSAPEAPAPVPEAPTPVTEAPAPEITSNNDLNALKVGIDVAANVDPKFVCKSGCNDSQDAKNVLSLRVNLENELKPRLDHFYNQEIPTAYEEKRSSLLDDVLNLLSGLRIDVQANVKANN